MEKLSNTLTTEQANEFREADQHEKNLHLLGRQMKSRLSRWQQKKIDMATKTFLKGVNTIRQKDFNMPP